MEDVMIEDDVIFNASKEHMRYRGNDKYKMFEHIKMFNNYSLSLPDIDSEIAYRALEDIVMYTPRLILACTIQDYSYIINKASTYEEGLLENVGKPRIGVGRILKEALAIRENMENGMVYKIRIPSLEGHEYNLYCTQCNGSLSHVIDENITDTFYYMLRDLKEFYTLTKRFNAF